MTPPFVPDRPIALVGLMGVGKTSLGRRLALALALPFVDADAEIEAAAGCSVADIFAQFGEEGFRDGERRVIARLLAGPPIVLATGGGAFAQPQTRDLLLEGALVVWLKADLATLAARVARKSHRPLVVGRDPMEVLTAQAAARFPHYERAHLAHDTADAAHGPAVDALVAALIRHCAPKGDPA